MHLPIYLDYSATAPVDLRVAERMTACLTLDGNFGNPASRSHCYGWKAEEAVEHARRQIADLVGADPREIVFTSGATESNNLAIKGIATLAGVRHIVTSTIEHKATLDPCEQLEREGFDVTRVAPTATGRIEANAVAAAIRDDTAIVSVMHANNEIGTVNDIGAIGAVCRARGVPFHVDAAQSAGKLPVDLRELPVDLMSLSAHKMYGPKGIGILYVRRQPPVRIAAQIHGGGHERGMRSGTLPIHQIVGFGEAARIAAAEMVEEGPYLTALRDRLWEGISTLPSVFLNGDIDHRLPGILNASFGGVDGEVLLLALKDLAVSSGSACTSASLKPSYVLRAIGVGDTLALASIRFSVGRFTTVDEIDFAVATVCETVLRLRGNTV